MVDWSEVNLSRYPQSTKKTDAPTPDDKSKPETETPTAPAGEDKKEESSTGVKNRKGN